jgi:chaperonin GroES
MVSNTPGAFKPLHDNILIKVAKSAEMVGGILMPDSARKREKIATVVAVGPGHWLENGQRVAPEVEPGDRVRLGDWEGLVIDELAEDDYEYRILGYTTLAAVLR